MGPRGHRIVEVGNAANAMVKRRMRLGGGRLGVARGDAHAARDEFVDEFERAGKLRRQRYASDGTRREQLPEQHQVGGGLKSRIVRAHPARRDERTLEVRSDHARAGVWAWPRHPAQRCAYRIQ